MHNQNASLPHSQNSTDSKPELTLILTNYLSAMLHDKQMTGTLCDNKASVPSRDTFMNFTTVCYKSTRISFCNVITVGGCGFRLPRYTVISGMPQKSKQQNSNSVMKEAIFILLRKLNNLLIFKLPVAHIE